MTEEQVIALLEEVRFVQALQTETLQQIAVLEARIRTLEWLAEKVSVVDHIASVRANEAFGEIEEEMMRAAIERANVRVSHLRSGDTPFAPPPGES